VGIYSGPAAITCASQWSGSSQCFHLSESQEFLNADLTRDPSQELAYAKQGHKNENALMSDKHSET